MRPNRFTEHRVIGPRHRYGNVSFAAAGRIFLLKRGFPAGSRLGFRRPAGKRGPGPAHVVGRSASWAAATVSATMRSHAAGSRAGALRRAPAKYSMLP